jgi:hypothetical protein
LLILKALLIVNKAFIFGWILLVVLEKKGNYLADTRFRTFGAKSGEVLGGEASKWTQMHPFIY